MHDNACVSQTVAMAAMPGMKFAPITVTVPPAYMSCGEMKFDVVLTVLLAELAFEEPVLFDAAAEVALEVFDGTAGSPGSGAPGMAIICKTLG